MTAVRSSTGPQGLQNMIVMAAPDKINAG